MTQQLVRNDVEKVVEKNMVRIGNSQAARCRFEVYQARHLRHLRH